MPSYIQAGPWIHSSQPKQGYPGAKEGSSEDELEDQMSDSEELYAVDGDTSTSDKDLLACFRRYI